MSPNGRRQLDNREDLLIRYVKMSLITLIFYLCFSAEADSRRHRRMFTTELAHSSFLGASTLLRMRSRIFAANRRHQTRGRSRFFFQRATKRRKQNILFDIALRPYLDIHSVKLRLSISILYFFHLKSLAWRLLVEWTPQHNDPNHNVNTSEQPCRRPHYTSLKTALWRRTILFVQ